MNGIEQKIPHALLAEDDRVLADILRLALVGAGFEVTVTHDGAKALGLAKKNTFDLILSDFQLPRLNGHQLLSGIRAEGCSSGAVLILCMAKAIELDSQKLISQLGLTAVLYKPICLSDLSKILQNSIFGRYSAAGRQPILSSCRPIY